MSLGKVPGESTPMLTEAFYTNLWEKKVSKVESVKQAWVTIRENTYGCFHAPIQWTDWVAGGGGRGNTRLLGTVRQGSWVLPIL